MVRSPYIDQHFKENESFSPFSPYGIAESSSKTINILNKVIATWQSPCSSYYHTSVLASFIWFIWTARSVEKDDSILWATYKWRLGLCCLILFEEVSFSVTYIALKKTSHYASIGKLYSWDLYKVSYVFSEAWSIIFLTLQ